MEKVVCNIMGYLNECYIFLIALLSHKEIFSAMEQLSILLVTLFVPLVFFLIQEQNGPLWDRKVILQYAIRPYRIVMFIALFAMSFFLWGIKTIRPFLFLLYGASIFFIIKIAIDAYNWIETDKSNLGVGGFKNTLREKYLNKTNNWVEKGGIWQDAWSQDLKLQAEQWLLPIFINNIDKLIEAKNYNAAFEYLSIFNHFLEKRALFYPPLYTALFKKLLIWHEKFYNAREDENSLCVQGTIEELIKKCLVSALQKYSSLFFDNLKAHTEGKENGYLEELFGFICGTFFNNIRKSSEIISIWGNENVKGCFPPAWKITHETMENEKNYIAKIWFAHFCYFAHPRINNHLEASFFDGSLEEISSELFPTVDPIIWSYILSFLYTHWEIGRRMQLLISKPKTFGFMSRGYHTTYESGIAIEEKAKEYLNKTYELALFLFEHGLLKDELKKCLDELENLPFEETEDKIGNKEQYNKIFNELLKRLDK